MAKLLPVLLALVGLAGGGAAGYVLRPDPVEPVEPALGASADANCPPPAIADVTDIHVAAAGEVGPSEFVNFENQFVVPVTSSEAIVSLVVLSLTLEVHEGTREAVFARLPKLRNAFLSVLFDHSSAGGFSSDFVNGKGLEMLRSMLKETAIGTAGSGVIDVLIVDLVKQDV